MKNLIKLLTILISVVSLSACNSLPTTTTSKELNNIYFLTDKEYSYSEVLKWAVDDKDIAKSSLIATCLPLNCDKVNDNQIYIDIVGSDRFKHVSITDDDSGDEFVIGTTVNTTSDSNKSVHLNASYNLCLDKEGSYTVSFGVNEKYVLNNLNLEYGKHYLIFCGTVEQLINIESHKGENRIHNGSNKVF